MKFYYAIPSTYAQKALIAIYEKDIDVEKIQVNLMDPVSRQDYAENVYPLGKIPLLIADDGRMVPESSIIIEYLEQSFPQSLRLFPQDEIQCRETRFKDRMCDLYLNDSIAKMFFELRKPESEQDAELLRKCRFNASYIYDRIEESLQQSEFIAGDNFSIADCAAIPPLFYAQKLHPFSDKRNLTNYFERVQNRPSYQKVLEELLPALAAFG